MMVPPEHPIYEATEWDSALLSGLPIDLLRWFAGDVSILAINTIQKKIRFRHGTICGQRRAIRNSRKLILGELSEESRKHCIDNDAYFARYHYSCHPYEKMISQVDAGLLYQQKGRMLKGTVHRLFDSKLKAIDKQELSEFALSRLRYLCDVWAMCGDRSAWLLLEGLCPIECPESAALPYERNKQ